MATIILPRRHANAPAGCVQQAPGQAIAAAPGEMRGAIRLAVSALRRRILLAFGKAETQAGTDRVGRVTVEAGLTHPGRGEVFVVADTGHVKGPDARPRPGIAAVARRQGEQGAHASSRDRPSRQPFRYRDLGAMATIGRKRAVAQIGGLHLTGFVAWLARCIVRACFLAGSRNRISMAANRAWSHATFRRGTRLTAGSAEPVPSRQSRSPASALRGS